MRIRPETRDDFEAIHALTRAAFAPMAYSQGNEAECVARLRADGDLVVSLVAIAESEIVGHVAFSPVRLDEVFNGWYGLGPISVAPNRQRRGIGGALIGRGLTELRGLGAQGAVLIGNPGYYSRFGFVAEGRLSYRDLPSAYVQWLAFGATKPAGVLTFSAGLE